MLGSPIVRLANEDDVAEIARLTVALGYRVSSAEIRSRLLSLQKTDTRFIAVVPGPDDTLLGWVAAEHRILLESGERAEIVGLIVDDSVRRRGVGKALVLAAEAWAVRRGLSTIFVRSNVKRASSHRFYGELGYERVKTQHAYSNNLLAV